MQDNKREDNEILVSIRCIAFNQEPYIRYALDGFVSQKTNFKFVAIVHDDASTDRTPDIIREYAERYPDIIKPILETENLYSKRDGSLARVMDEACTGKYIAYCEGDDYWIDPLKLQKQVDFLEAHPDYSMCWTDAFQETKGVKKAYNRYPESCQSPTEDIIGRGGDFIPTCSILLRHEVLKAMPKEAKGFYVGDYPLQMWSAFSGKCYYIKEQTCVYRYASIGSWTSRAERETKEQKIKHFQNEKKLLDAFNKLSNYKFNAVFERRAADILFWILYSTQEYEMMKPYVLLRRKYGLHIDLNKAQLMRVYGHPHIARVIDFAYKVRYKLHKIISGK